jgi:hypothetical protein
VGNSRAALKEGINSHQFQYQVRGEMDGRKKKKNLDLAHIPSVFFICSHFSRAISFSFFAAVRHDKSFGTVTFNLSHKQIEKKDPLMRQSRAD